MPSSPILDNKGPLFHRESLSNTPHLMQAAYFQVILWDLVTYVAGWEAQQASNGPRDIWVNQQVCYISDRLKPICFILTQAWHINGTLDFKKARGNFIYLKFEHIVESNHKHKKEKHEILLLIREPYYLTQSIQPFTALCS